MREVLMETGDKTGDETGFGVKLETFVLDTLSL